jgi:hypothetical protein
VVFLHFGQCFKLNCARPTIHDYAYDFAGNPARDITGMTFIYDGENKQIEALNVNDEPAGRYWYDGDGRWVKKYVPATGAETIFIYDAANKPVAEYSMFTGEKPQVAYATTDNLGSPGINTD